MRVSCGGGRRRGTAPIVARQRVVTRSVRFTVVLRPPAVAAIVRRTVRRRLAPGVTAAAGSLSRTVRRLAVSLTIAARSFARLPEHDTVPVTRALAAVLLDIHVTSRPLLTGLAAVPSATVSVAGAGAVAGATGAGVGDGTGGGTAALGAGAGAAGTAGAGVGFGCAALPVATASHANCTDVVAPWSASSTARTPFG